MRCITEGDHNYECRQLETVGTRFQGVFSAFCGAYLPETKRKKKKNSTKLDLRVLLDTIKSLEAVVKVLELLLQLRCLWFACLERLVEVLLTITGIDLP